MKRQLIPFASYLSVTVLVPVLNGAPIDAQFLENATLIIIITGTLSTLVCIGNHGLSQAKIAAPHQSSRCDLCLRSRVKSGACLPGECPHTSTPDK